MGGPGPMLAVFSVPQTGKRRDSGRISSVGRLPLWSWGRAEGEDPSARVRQGGPVGC